MNSGETPEHAARRELAEELGTDRAAIVDVFPRWLRYDYPSPAISRRARVYRGQQHLWFLMRFEGEDDHIRVGTDHAEFDKWTWASPDELIDWVVPFKRQVYREVLTYFAPSLRLAGTAVPGRTGDRRVRLPDAGHPPL